MRSIETSKLPESPPLGGFAASHLLHFVGAAKTYDLRLKTGNWELATLMACSTCDPPIASGG